MDESQSNEKFRKRGGEKHQWWGRWGGHLVECLGKGKLKILS